MRYINTTYRRTGTLWDSRYQSSRIHVETVLLRCQRYIELNPVHAAMIDDPVDYRWSNYRHNALGQANGYPTPHPRCLALGATSRTRRAAYRGLFRSELEEDAIRDNRLAINQNQPLGSARFYAKIKATTGQRRGARPRGRPRARRDPALGQELGQGELP